MTNHHPFARPSLCRNAILLLLPALAPLERRPVTCAALALQRLPGDGSGTMFSGLTPTTNFVLRIALAFGAGLMMAALL